MSDEIKQTLNGINTTDLSKYGIKKTNVSLNSDFYEKALNDFSDEKGSFQFVWGPGSGVSNTTVSLAEVQGDGFRLKEINFPRPPWDEPNDVPTVGTPTNTPLSRGWIYKASIGNANLDLSFSCNFVAPLNINSCLFTFQLIWKSQIERLQKYALYIIRRTLPIFDLIMQLKDMFCRILKLIAKYICWIKSLIACILSTVQAIIQIITWLLTLPVRYLLMLIQCVSNFLSNITNSLGQLLNIFNITGAFGLLCEGAFNCPDGSSALDYKLS